MNIFILDTDPKIAAQMQCDKHVVKMVLETAQLLCSVFDSGVAPYKRTHFNHPSAVWARTSHENYAWLVQHGIALCAEYQHRYGKVHASEDVILWCFQNWPVERLPRIGLTPFALAMPDQYKRADPVEAYRAYYQGAKASIATWKAIRGRPAWWSV